MRCRVEPACWDSGSLGFHNGRDNGCDAGVRQSCEVPSVPQAVDELVAVVSDMTGQSATLVDDLSFSNRAIVARVRFGGGETVIAKKPLSPSAFANEVDALQLLPAETRPALIGSANGMLVMEDLGSGPSLADLLLSHDRGAAERALHAWARALGAALAATLRSGAPASRVSLERGLEELVGFAGDLGVAVPVGVEADAGLIEDTLSADSRWLAYCPGDTCPDNNRVLSDGSVRFFDFESAGWRHAATEAAYCRAPFCTCWCVAALPTGMTASMEIEFLDALDPPQREPFRTVIGLAAVSFTVTTFGHFRRFVMDGSPVGPPGRTPSDGRQYVMLRLATVESEQDRIPALAELANGLSEAILRRWPSAAEPPIYAAFR
jgi:hypothetical protein